MKRTSCSISVAAPNTHTRMALTRCICGTLRVRSQSQASSSSMRDHEHGGGRVDAAELVGDEEDDQRCEFDQGLHAACVRRLAKGARMIPAPRGAVSCAATRTP